VLGYLAAHGDESDCAILEKWMKYRDLQGIRWRNAGAYSFAGRAWYDLKWRLCKTDAERRAFAKSVIDPWSSVPDGLGVEGISRALDALGTDARDCLYEVLAGKLPMPMPVRDRVAVIADLVGEAGYRPDAQETERIMGSGGEFGRYAIARQLGAGGRARPYLIDKLECRNLTAFLLAADLAAEFVRTRDLEVLTLVVGMLEYALAQPLSREREQTMHLCLGMDVDGWQEGRELLRPWCRRVLDTQPELHWSDAKQFAGKPGIHEDTEAGDIVVLRRWLRSTATRQLSSWGEREGTGHERGR
jgi:hypothetical protein